MSDEQEIRRLMKAGMDDPQTPARVSTVLSKARRQVGQRDTISFAMVRIWAVLARLLAPLFAAFSERQAGAIHQHSRRRVNPPHNKTQQEEGESK